jgi:predicted metal-dependent TIM-barrel fold hydrolase
MERRKFCGNTSSDDIAAATVRPENSTVRPAVRIVARIAVDAALASSSGSFASSSRYRLITNSA